MSYPLDRRAFLTATGLAGALAVTPGFATAGTSPEVFRQALATLTRDTLSGVAVFVMPGPDAYSRHQGTPRTEPGGIEAKVPAFLIDTLDRFLPFPDQIAIPLLRALRQGAASLDAGTRRALENDATIPLSPVVALLLNLEAVRINPAAIAGPFLSPFSRLSFRDKGRVFQLMEGPDPAMVALLDGQLPEPLRGSISGLLKFLTGSLLELTALGSYSEWAVLDRTTKRLRSRPVGWRIAGYTPSADGWDDFKGYYQGRRKVTG